MAECCMARQLSQRPVLVRSLSSRMLASVRRNGVDMFGYEVLRMPFEDAVEGAG